MAGKMSRRSNNKSVFDERRGIMAMAQERNEETARFVAVRSLKNELELAIKLLRGVKEARATMAMESQVVDGARSAFRHAVEALGRMPQLEPDDMQAVQKLIDEFRSELATLDQ
jgi:hypothetical protein